MEGVNIVIAETSKGKATVANRNFAVGELILILTGVPSKTRDRYSVQIGVGQHLIPTELGGKYLNHACDPNAAVERQTRLIALKPIFKGEEITFDYETTEDEIAAPFHCSCGSTNCRGKIGG